MAKYLEHDTWHVAIYNPRQNSIVALFSLRNFPRSQFAHKLRHSKIKRYIKNPKSRWSVAMLAPHLLQIRWSDVGSRKSRVEANFFDPMARNPACKRPLIFIELHNRQTIVGVPNMDVSDLTYTSRDTAHVLHELKKRHHQRNALSWRRLKGC